MNKAKGDRRRKRKIIQSPWFPWFIGGLLVLSSNWSSDVIEEGLGFILTGINSKVLSIIVKGGYVILFIFLVWFVYKTHPTWFRPRAKVMRAKEEPSPRKHLIIFLSDLKEEQGAKNEGIPYGVTLQYDLRKDLETLAQHKSKPKGIKWPWEMPLRAINHHQRVLKTLTILCSQKSLKQVQWFQNILKKYIELSKVKTKIFVEEKGKYRLITRCNISKHKGFDFEDFDKLFDALASLLEEFRDKRIPENEVTIDFTGGQKPTSVVAAAMTFNRNVLAQYVQTGGNWEIIGYKTELPTSDKGSLGI